MIIAMARIAVAILAICACFDWFGITFVHVWIAVAGVVYMMVCEIYDEVTKE